MENKDKIKLKDIIKNELKENGVNPHDYTIEIDKNGSHVYPKYNLEIRKAFEKEDEKVKTEADYNSAISVFELLQLSEDNIKKLELEISQSDFEMLMIINTLTNKVEELENKLKEK